MSSYLPQWVTDISVLCSIAGLIWTAVVWRETRRIRAEFLVKIRLPDVLKGLKLEVQQLLASLDDWQNTGSPNKAHESISKLKGLLLNLRLKVSNAELKQVDVVIGVIEQRVGDSCEVRSVSELSLVNGWKLAGEVNTLLSMLGQRVKDMRWD